MLFIIFWNRPLVLWKDIKWSVNTNTFLLLGWTVGLYLSWFSNFRKKDENKRSLGNKHLKGYHELNNMGNKRGLLNEKWLGPTTSKSTRSPCKKGKIIEEANSYCRMLLTKVLGVAHNIPCFWHYFLFDETELLTLSSWE